MPNKNFDFQGAVKAEDGSTIDPVMLDNDPEETTVQQGMVVYHANPLFTPEDLQVAKLRLAQGLTAEVQEGTAKPGDWVLSGLSPMKEVTIIPIMAGKRRRRIDSDRNIVCSSNDAVQGVGDPGMACAECPFSQWTPDPQKPGKNLPPTCTFIYSYQVVLPQFQMPATLEFSRTSEGAARLLNTLIFTRQLGKFGVKLTAQPQSGARGNFYTPTVSLTNVSEEDLAFAQKFAATT